MTTAKLTSSPPEGSGLTNRFNDQQYSALVKGEPTGHVVMVVVAEAVGYGQRKTAKGVHQHVIYDYIIVEPILDAHDAEQIRYLAQASWDKRHSVATLPLDFPSLDVGEQRRSLLTLVDEWAGEEGLTNADVGERWRTHYGIEANTKDTPAGWAHPDYRKATPNHLREFALASGVIADGADSASDDGEKPDAGEGDEPDDEAAS